MQLLHCLINKFQIFMKKTNRCTSILIILLVQTRLPSIKKIHMIYKKRYPNKTLLRNNNIIFCVRIRYMCCFIDIFVLLIFD